MSKGAECWTDSTSISPKERPGLIATPRAALLGRQEKICLSSVEPFYETPDRGEHFSVEECFCLLFLLLPGKTLSKHLWCSEDLQQWASAANGRDSNKICTAAKALLICKSLWIYRRENTADWPELSASAPCYILCLQLPLNTYCLKLFSCLQPYIIFCQSFVLSKIFISTDFAFISMGFMEIFNSTSSAVFPFTVALVMMVFHWHLLHEISQLLIHCRVLLFNANAIQYIVTMPKKKCTLLKNKCTLSR